MKQLLRTIYNFLNNFYKINLLKTIYINFKTQPFIIAIKFPIFIYGKLIIPVLNGQIQIDAPIKTGMIKIGYRYLDLVPASYLPTQLYLLKGKIVFKGNCLASGGVSLFASNSEISIGNCCVIGGGTMIKSLSDISIGNNTRIAYETVIFDSNIHYVKNIETGEIANNKAPITIGENCWINSRSFIGKGSIIPNFTVVAGSSFVNKDYSSFGENLFLVGSPAKPGKSKVQRIFSTTEESRLNAFFQINKKSILYKGTLGLFKDSNEMFN